MTKIGVLLAAVLMLFGPCAGLLGVGALMNPAAKAACLAGGLTVGPIPDALTATTTGGVTVSLDRTQLTRAATIITTGGRTPGVTRDAIVIALMAALTESRLRMLANTHAYPASANYPHDGDGADNDSLGLFQMRPQSGWGTVAQLMDPVYQARAFYGGPTGPNRGDPPGLLDIHGWTRLTKGRAAQAVERSAYPDRYATWEPVAHTILDALTRPVAQPDPSVPEATAVVFPLPAGTWVKTSGYGWRIHPITGLRTFHKGTDYAAKDGTPIMAVADGTVTFAGPMSGFGNAIIIRHTIAGTTVTSLYGHMWNRHLYVHTGDRVTAGQHIADVGSNGRSTGPHLHLEIRINARTVDSDRWLRTHAATDLDRPGATAAGCYL